MSHTNGPWHWYHAGGLNRYCVSDKNHQTICGLPAGNEADAYLISAAPDLLAACEDLLLVAGTYKQIDMYDWERVSAVIDQAKAALKKARGEE